MDYRFPTTRAMFRYNRVSHSIRMQDKALKLLPAGLKKRSSTIHIAVRAERAA